MATQYNTYGVVGNREDLTDIVSTVALSDTPIFSSLAKAKAASTLHEWQTDSLVTAQSGNAQVEGASYQFDNTGARTRVSNWTQIFTRGVQVSGTEEAMNPAGIDDEFAYQLEKKMKEIATDIEYFVLSGTGNSGSASVARTMKGLVTWITTNVDSATANRALVETTGTGASFNGMLQTIWNSGGKPDTVYCKGNQKKIISAFSGNNTRYLEVSGDVQTAIKNSVAVYDSDFGRVQVKLEPFLDENTVLVLESDLFSMAYLRPIKTIDVPSTADGKQAVILGEMTLESKNQKGSGIIKNLT